MSGRYGMSQAAKHIQEGRYEEAIAEATRLYARDETDPAPLLERAEAHTLLDRYPEAVADLEKAVELDLEAGTLDTETVDDSYFSALLGAARKEAEGSAESGVKRLGRYAEIFPSGRHLNDAAKWARRFRGESS